MLGLADRGRVLDLFDMIVRGDAAAALTELSGAICRWRRPDGRAARFGRNHALVSVIKITPEAAEDPTIPPDERERGLDMAGRLPMRVLTRMWQMLLKALGRGGAGPQRDDGRRNGRDPADPCGRSARPRNPDPQAAIASPSPAPTGGAPAAAAAVATVHRNNAAAGPGDGRRARGATMHGGRCNGRRLGPRCADSFVDVRTCGRSDPRTARYEAAGRGGNHACGWPNTPPAGLNLNPPPMRPRDLAARLAAAACKAGPARAGP